MACILRSLPSSSSCSLSVLFYNCNRVCCRSSVVDCSLGPTTGKLLADALKKNHSVQRLFLHSMLDSFFFVFLRVFGIVVIVDVRPQNETDNALGDEGIIAIAQMLTVNTTLATLSLCGMQCFCFFKFNLNGIQFPSFTGVLISRSFCRE